MPAAHGNMIYRADVDGLRALAVGSVVAFHAFPALLPGGFVGVDIFFVISGFLISGIIFSDLERNTFSFGEFYGRRIRRIFPALLCVLIATWVIAWFFFVADDYAVLGWHLSAASVFLSNFVLGTEAGYFDGAAEYKPLLHLWSLAVEEQFYFIWPGLLFAIWRFRLPRTPILAVITLASFGLNIVAAHWQPTWDFYSLPTRLWELALGSLLASSQIKLAGRNIREAIGVVGMGVILVSILYLNGKVSYPGWAALLPTIGAALLILAGPDTWLSQRVFSDRFVVAVGLISYPLYLWHWPLLSFARYALLREPQPLMIVGVIAMSVMLSWVTYQFVEKPIRFGMSERPNWRRAVSPILLCLLCGIGVVGLITRKAEGFNSRFPDPVRFLTSYNYDVRNAYRGSVCSLGHSQTTKDFESICNGRTSQSDTKPIVFLWGDSHAAHLYPGFSQMQAKKKFSIAQFTPDGCPPLLGRNFRHLYASEGEVRWCHEMNEFILQKLTALKPESLVLAAQWWEVPAEDIDQISATIAQAKDAGVKNIIIVGPVPIWNPSLPKLLLKYYETSFPKHLPEQMGGASIQSEIDAKLRMIAAKEGIKFVSAIDVFCERDQCLAKLPGAMGDIVAWDAAHLTDTGSLLMATAIYKIIDPKSADSGN
jgi:peptidoglycan/LPS O-acetylase OafA/YrhL